MPQITRSASAGRRHFPIHSGFRLAGVGIEPTRPSGHAILSASPKTSRSSKPEIIRKSYCGSPIRPRKRRSAPPYSAACRRRSITTPAADRARGGEHESGVDHKWRRRNRQHRNDGRANERRPCRRALGCVLNGPIADSIIAAMKTGLTVRLKEPTARIEEALQRIAVLEAARATREQPADLEFSNVD